MSSQTRIYEGVHGTTMVEIINPVNNLALDFFKLFSAWGDSGKMYPYDENSQCFAIECGMDFLSLAATEEMQKAFRRLGLEVTLPCHVKLHKMEG